MKQLFTNILIALVLILVSCTKDPHVLTENSLSSLGTDEFVFKPCALLEEPINGWKDSTKGTEKDIFRALINPLDYNQLIYMAGYKLYNYNRSTKSRKMIYNDIALTPGTPTINKFGWITFNNSQMQTCTIKSNGDSLKILASNAFYPRWDYTGKYIYFHTNLTLKRTDMYGINIDSILNYSILGVAKTANIVVSTRPSLQQLFMKNLDDGKETAIIVRDPRYDFLVFDNEDENIYWGYGAILTLNLKTLKLDTLVKSCPVAPLNTPANPNTYIFGTNISPGSDKLTFIYRVSTPVNRLKLYTEAYVLQMDLKTRKITEIKLFD